MGNARYVGRVGALAVALGIGTAVAASPWVAVADPGADASASESSNESSSTASASADDSKTTTSVDSSGADTSADTPEGADETDDESAAATDTSTSETQEVAGEEPADTEPATDPEPSTAEQPPVVETPPTAAEPVAATEDSNSNSADAESAISDPPAARALLATPWQDADTLEAEASDEVSAHEPAATVALTSRSSAALDSTSAQESPATAVTADLLPAAPVNPIRFVSDVVSAVLTWVGLGPSPTTPAESPGLLGLLAWVRREIQRTFFNRTASFNYNHAENSETIEVDGRVTALTGNLNAVDPDGDPLTFTVVDAPDNGTVVINRDGTFTYTPNPELARTGGTDRFVVKLEDNGLHWHGPGGIFNPGLGHNDTAVIDIPVAGPQLTPVVIATIDVGDWPLDVAFSPDGSRAYVTNKESDSVSVIETATNTVSATIAVGDSPYRVAVHPDGTKAYVTNYDDWTVSVIDTASNTVTDTITVGSAAGKGADYVVFSPDGSKAYVGSSNMLQVIDTATDTVIDTRILGFGPYGIAVSPDGDWVYVASWTGDYVRKIRTIPNGTSYNIDVGNSPVGVTMSADGSRLYVTNADGHSVSVIDTDTDAVIKTIAPAGNTPVEVAISPVGNLAYVVGQFSGTVKVVDTTTNTVIKTFNLGVVASSMAVSPDGTRGYVTDREGGTVRVMNLAPLLD